MMNLHDIEGPVIRTFTGKLFNVFMPDPELICIEDIAHALANLCRWGGHSKFFYSVAEHSFLCSQQVQWHEAKAALLHDAAEAYLVDLPRPIKRQMPDYEAIEDKLMQAIAKKFDFTYPLSEEVKGMDEMMLEAEWQALMLGNGNKLAFECFDPHAAKQIFKDQFMLIQKLHF